MDKIKIAVVTHKKAPIPNDEMYIPLFVGATNKIDEAKQMEKKGYLRDDKGDNISKLNNIFGTQTALYWLWKNTNYEYTGLVHYRRYFVLKKDKKVDMIDMAIKYKDIEPLLSKYKVFTPKKRYYIIETLKSHYEHSHMYGDVQLNTVEDVIKEKYPNYLDSYHKIMKRRWGYMFNLMILKRDLLEDYCPWLFNILFEVNERIDKSNMSDFDKRFGGRLSELLFDVWLQFQLENNKLNKSEIKELKYVEDVNWPFKIKTFLSAKFLHKKQTKSS